MGESVPADPRLFEDRYDGWHQDQQFSLRIPDELEMKFSFRHHTYDTSAYSPLDVELTHTIQLIIFPQAVHFSRTKLLHGDVRRLLEAVNERVLASAPPPQPWYAALSRSTTKSRRSPYFSGCYPALECRGGHGARTSQPSTFLGGTHTQLPAIEDGEGIGRISVTLREEIPDEVWGSGPRPEPSDQLEVSMATFDSVEAEQDNVGRTSDWRWKWSW